jgi:hypothetical protein
MAKLKTGRGVHPPEIWLRVGSSLSASAGRSEREAVAMGCLAGRTVERVEIDEDGAANIIFKGGLVVRVLCDPEGNGPGSLHVYTVAGEFLGVAGGR